MSDWEDVPKQDDWEDMKPSSFQSGSAFKDTKALIPDLAEAWETFKKQWENRHNTPITADDMHKMMGKEKAAGSAVLDTIGGLPAMAAGGVAGVGSAIANMDATQGLKTGGEVMSSLLPSSLMGNKEDQQNEGYHAAMAPVTAVMDTLNAAPQGYGEILNALGYDKAAAQVTDAGKLGIMAGFGAKGAHEMYKGIKGDGKASEDHAAKIDTGWEDVPAKAEEVLQKADDVGFQDIPHQQDMLATNPYDVAGHVTEAQEGRPATVDAVQGDLFGKELEKAIPTGEVQPPAPRLNETTAFPEAIEANTKAAEAPIDISNPAMQEAMIKAQREAAFKTAEQTAQAQKDIHYQQLEHIEIAKRAGEIGYQRVKDMGDKTVMDQVANEQMAGAIREGNLSNALEVISKNHADRPYRDLAAYLKDKVEGITTQLHPEDMIRAGDRDVSGYFDPNTGTVGYSGVGAASPHTVMHEAVHAVTSQFMQARPNDVRVVAIKNLYNKLSDKFVKEFPGIVNTREFVAEAFSNPKFQEFLKGQRIDNRSAFQRFVDGVKTIFGMKTNIETTVTNALTHAIDLSKQVIEASDKTTRDTIMEQFKSAGMSPKMADLMAQAPKEPPAIKVVRNEEVRDVATKIPGLTDVISDFKFYDKPVEEIIQMAQTSPDIPSNVVEKFGQQMQAGALFESLKTRNPIIKYTYERITRATQEAAHQIKVNLTDPATGLKHYMRDLTPDQKGEIHSLIVLNEGVKEFTSHELAERGFNEKQIAYYNKQRELDNQFYEDINTRRVAMGLEPMDKRVAHLAGRFMGDFSRIVTAEVPHPTTGNMQTKVVGRISGSTKWELERATKYMKEQHPDWNFNQAEYNSISKGRNAADRFGGLMEALNFITKTNSDAAALLQSYRDYIQSDAVNYLNATRHAKAKVVEAGGVKGSEGNKPWLDTVKNAEEGMKAQLAYFEQGYQWMAMEKAVGDLKPMLGDETLARTSPNALKYANQYVDHALGRNQGIASDFSNAIASMVGEYSGIGHTNLMKANNQVKHFMMQKFMGLMNIPFSVTQLLQPLQTHPAMVTLLKGRGLEFSAAKAQVHATETYIKALMKEKNLDPFESAAMKYADEMGIFDVKMSDHLKDINASPLKEGYNKFADLNINVPEKLTRGMSFLFYAHALKDAGVSVKDIFGAAENMTNMTMVNYHPIERPMGYAKLGWIGDVASTLTRYKHNQYSQMAFYAREGLRAENGIKSSAPLGAFLGTSLAFGGIMGFFGFQEADALYQLFREKVLGKPDSLTDMLFRNHVPPILTHGVFSLLGLDMTSRFSNANLIPDNIGQAVLPYGSAVLDMAQATGRFVLDPTNDFKQKQLLKAWAPQSVQGLMENKLFTTKTTDGKNLYTNSTDGPNLGKGRVERSDANMKQRAWGFRDIRESTELAKNYSDSQISKAHSNIADGLVEKTKYAILGNTATEASITAAVRKASEHGMSPDTFTSQLVKWGQDRQLTQKQQIMLNNAQKGFTGAFNIQQGQQ